MIQEFVKDDTDATTKQYQCHQSTCRGLLILFRRMAQDNELPPTNLPNYRKDLEGINIINQKEYVGFR